MECPICDADVPLLPHPSPLNSRVAAGIVGAAQLTLGDQRESAEHAALRGYALTALPVGKSELRRWANGKSRPRDQRVNLHGAQPDVFRHRFSSRGSKFVSV
jgi:hypothetical protein